MILVKRLLRKAYVAGGGTVGSFERWLKNDVEARKEFMEVKAAIYRLEEIKTKYIPNRD